MIGIIDYGAGNTMSVKNALERLDAEVIISKEKEVLNLVDKLILPGVGDAGYAMDRLKGSNLIELIKLTSKPLLGICLGLQLLCRHSEENDTDCLGIFDIDVKLFPPDQRVPHIGWNELKDNSGVLTKGIEKDSDVYFVHSYYAGLSEWTSSTAHYILPFSACIEKDNYYAAQFHPEKSGDIGETILKNFLDL